MKTHQRPEIVTNADDPNAIQAISQTLRSIATLASALQGAEALGLLNAGYRPDLTLLDVMTSGMVRHEGRQRMMKGCQSRAIPTIFIEASSDAGREMRAREAGAADLMRTPISRDVVRPNAGGTRRTAGVSRFACLSGREPMVETRGARCVAGPLGRPSQILIVDDDPTAIRVLNNAVADLAECRFALRGREALEILRDFAADLILLDAAMPGLDGYATCRALKREHPDLPIIFVTAAHDPGSEVRALEAGAVDFISKPVVSQVVRARVSTHLKLKAQSDLMQAMIRSDPLTGIANRRALDEHLRVEWQRAWRHWRPLALLMIDIDHFKAYNDHYGHLAGDRCLQRVADAIVGSLGRAGDLAARYGGEEFAVLLPETHLTDAGVLAEKIGAAVRDLVIPHASSAVAECVTVSIGVAGAMPEDSGRYVRIKPAAAIGHDMFERADAALYAAKGAGRNRAICDGRGLAARSGPVQPRSDREVPAGHVNGSTENAL